MDWWLSLFPHSKNVLDSILGLDVTSFCMEFRCSPYVCVGPKSCVLVCLQAVACVAKEICELNGICLIKEELMKINKCTVIHITVEKILSQVL